MFFITVLALLGVFIVSVIICPINACVSIRLRSEICIVRISFKLLLGVISVGYEYRFVYEQGGGILIYKRVRTGNYSFLGAVGAGGRAKEKGILSKALKESILDSFSVRQLCINGEFGIMGNTYLSVMVTGVLNILFRAAIDTVRILECVRSGCNRLTVFGVDIAPCMTDSCFALNVESIIRINSGKFISKTARAFIRVTPKNRRKTK